MDVQAINDSIAALTARLSRAGLDERRKVAGDLYNLCYAVGELAQNAVPPLVECLQDDDEKVRESAQWGLGYCAPHSIEPLIVLVQHSRSEVRFCAAYALGNIGARANLAAPAVRPLLQDSNSDIRSRGALTLGLMRDQSAQTLAALAAMCSSQHSSDRSAALHAFGNIGNERSEPTLLDPFRTVIFAGIEDADADVRWSGLYAAESLEMDHAAKLTLASRCLTDSTDRVREMALSWLSKLAEAGTILSSLPQLRAIVGERSRVSSIACEVLSKMGPDADSAVPSLLACLNHNNEQLQLRAAEAIWKITCRVDQILPVLGRLMQDNGESVCDIVCEIGAPASPLISELVKALETEDWDLQWAAADALGAVASNGPQVITALIDAFAHDSSLVRSAARRALVKVGADAVPALVRLLDDDGNTSKDWVADTLGAMGLIAKEAVPSLCHLYRTGHGAERDWSAIAVGKITCDSVFTLHLQNLVSSERESYLRAQAMLALAAIRPEVPNLMETLTVFLYDTDDGIAATAQEALAILQSRKLGN